jgi:hypothetical protein
VERQLRDRAGIADELNLSRGDGARAVVVPHGVAGRRGHPAPAQDVLHRDVGERFRNSLQRRSRCGVSVGGQLGKPVEQQVDGVRSTRASREGLDRAAYLEEHATSLEIPGGDERRAPGGQIGTACELEVERFEPPGGVQQEGGSIAEETRGESDVAAQQVDPGALEPVERSGLRRGHQPERRVERPRLEADSSARPGLSLGRGMGVGAGVL